MFYLTAAILIALYAWLAWRVSCGVLFNHRIRRLIAETGRPFVAQRYGGGWLVLGAGDGRAAIEAVERLASLPEYTTVRARPPEFKGGWWHVTYELSIDPAKSRQTGPGNEPNPEEHAEPMSFHYD